MLRILDGIRVAAMTAAIPPKVLDKDFFAALYGAREAGRVALGTGIKEIRVADRQSTTDLLYGAASHLLSSVDIDRSTIDGLVVVTQTPDAWSPGVSYGLHHALCLEHDCYLLDLNAGCAGYVSGLTQAAALVRSKACKNVLLCTGDVNTRLTADSAHQVRMLFGDAASATLVTEGSQSLRFLVGSDGSGSKRLGVDIDYQRDVAHSASVGYLAMDGAAVMSFALRRVPDIVKRLLSSLQMSKEDIDYYILHQPNELMLNYLRDALDVPSEKFLVDVGTVGNTNSTSIPLVISRQLSKAREGAANVILSGFGVGLAWNALHLDLSNTHVIPPTECHERQTDHNLSAA